MHVDSLNVVASTLSFPSPHIRVHESPTSFGSNTASVWEQVDAALPGAALIAGNQEGGNALSRGLRTLGPSAAWALTAQVFNQGSTLVSNIWIANILGRTLFGEYAIVLATVQAAAALAILGLGYTTSRYLAEWRHRDPERAGRLLGLLSRLCWISAACAALLLAGGASGIAGGALGAPQLKRSIVLAGTATIFIVRCGFLTGALGGLGAFRLIGISGVISGITYFALTVGGALAGGVGGASVGLCASALVQCVVLQVSLNSEAKRQAIKPGVATFSEERPMLMRFALPAALSGVSTVPVLWSLQALLARSPNGFAQLAVYAAGLNLTSMVLFAPTVLNSVAMTWINSAQAVHGEHAYRSALRTNVLITGLTVTFALLGMVLVGPWLLSLYGRDFRAGYPALIFLLLASVPESLTIALNQSLQARERMWAAFLGINIPRDLVILLVGYQLIPQLGARGAAIGYLCGRLVALGFMIYLVRHEAPATATVVPEVRLQ